MVFQKSITKTIETTETKRPDTPQITIKNPLDKETFVNGIELILEPEFSKKGKLVILVNDVAIFDENDSKGFFGYAKYPIPLNKQLRRSNDIKVFAWNGDDSNKIGLRLNIAISENPEPFQSQAVPLGRDVLNTVVSEPETVFDIDDYKDTELTKLISLEGNSSLLLLIGASNALVPTVLDKNSQFTGTADNAADGSLTSAASATTAFTRTEVQTTGNKRLLWFDFGQAIGREVGIKARIFSNGIAVLDAFTLSVWISESPDDVGYTTLHEETLNVELSDTSFDIFIDSNFTPKPDTQFIRIIFRVLEAGDFSGPNGIVNVFEVYDYHRRTGTAQVSFEILEPSTNQWIEYISSGEIGAITQGNAIQKQIGSLMEENPSNNSFKRFLPSTQTQFRAKMIVTGNIRTSVSILKGR